MEGAKQGLELLSTVLDAAPIPEPFKSAVKGIPDIVLQILTIVEAVKGNVSGSYDRTLRLWNATTGAPIGGAMQGHSHSVRCVAVSPDSKTIISQNFDTEIFQWEASSQRRVDNIEQPQPSFDSHVASVSLTLDPHGWILDSKRKRLAWVPVALRGQL
ncbi:hypothetical protein FRB97_005386, partial [Tulasnella sp. 331]